MLRLNKIVKKYNVASGDVLALDGVTLSFRNNEFVSILGPSGCGKTTLLNIIGGLDKYTDGDLVINGISTKLYKDKDWDYYRNHSIGFVFQSYNLIPHQSVLANVELALTLSGVSKKERRAKSIEALEKVGLGDQINKKPNQMSGGQMQRVAIARALVNDPDILLADEPTGALDTATSVQVMELLKEISHDKLVIMVTHNPEIAEEYSSRIVKLRDGKVVDDSNPFSESDADKETEQILAECKKTEEKEGNAEKKVKKKRQRSMSFFTALSLSLNNLMTKKGRTFMTSFAGSIGIIGIALILALSTGIQLYIDNVQRETLSSYPIMLQNEEMDLAAVMGSMQGVGSGKKHKKDAVYADATAYEMLNSVFGKEKKKNNLTAFKSWIDKELDSEKATTDFSELAAAVHYQYAVDLNTYVYNEEGEYVSTSLGSAMPDIASSSVGSGDVQSAFQVQMQASLSSVNMWKEILPGKNGELVSDMIIDQFDVVEGHWPQKANEVVLVVSKDNEINDFAFYTLGMMPAEEIQQLLQAVMSQTSVDIDQRVASYEKILNTKLKLVVTADYYQDNDGDGIYESIKDDDFLMESVVQNGYDLKISGIVRPKEDVSSTALTGPFGYTYALTEYIIDKTNDSEVVKAQMAPENQNYDVLSGRTFSNRLNDLSDEEKVELLRDYFISLDAKQKTSLYKEIMAMVSDEEVNYVYDSLTAGEDVRTVMEELLASQKDLPVETIRDHLDNYSDDKLVTLAKDYIKEQLEIMKTTYVDFSIKSLMISSVETEEKINGIIADTIAKLPGNEEKIAYIAENWPGMEIAGNADATVEQGKEIVYMYLMSLEPEQFSSLLTSVILVQNSGDFSVYETEEAFGVVAGLFDQMYLSDSFFSEENTETLVALFEEFIPSDSATIDDNFKTLGVADKKTPSAISIYPETFEDKDEIAKIITDYNKTVSEDDKIEYTDYMALFMSGVSTIIDAVSYGLIAFVSISLVVSSIMIGIITYISVLERTKEIGILRAIGASKKDISRVFNAETLIVGFTSGMIGIIASLILCIPINIIIKFLSGTSVVNAQLPVIACVVLVLISMGLTFIAGLFPSKVAANKDPVVALRTE